MGQPLYMNQMQGQVLTIVIYWHPKKGPDLFQNGHSALVIDSVQFDPFQTDYYVSWSGSGGKNPFKAGGQASTFWSDVSDWGGFQTAPGTCVPKRWVAIQNLNIQAMKQEWDNIRTKQNAHWKLVDKNCATTVARVLKAGGGDNFANRARDQLIWWPTDLIRYARSMGQNVHSHS